MNKKVALKQHLARLERGELRKAEAAKKAGGSYIPKKFKITSDKEAKQNPQHVVLNLGSRTKTGYKTKLGEGAKLLRGQKVAPNIKTFDQTKKKAKDIDEAQRKGAIYTSESGREYIDRALTPKNMGKHQSYLRKTYLESARHLRKNLKTSAEGLKSLKSSRKARKTSRRALYNRFRPPEKRRNPPSLWKRLVKGKL